MILTAEDVGHPRPLGADAAQWGRGSRALRQPDAAVEAAPRWGSLVLSSSNRAAEASRRLRPQAFQRGAVEAPTGP